ncbi:MAG TPA: gamma-glutamyltransferase [Burkholderiales bacterium]|nr:gamma-glutamyltransferase [Burkholderiales bacterium]
MTTLRAILAKRAAAAALFLFGAPLALLLAGCAQLAPRDEPGFAPSGPLMVAAAHPLAVDAGMTVLRLGGSAVDAAVAVQAVLGLVEPQSSGIGGGAFMLYWSEQEKKLRAYDGRETAPAAARPARFLDAQGRPLDFVEAVESGRSVGVPGVLRLLELAHERHGRLRWAENLRYAIYAAEEGFPMPPRLHAALERNPHLRDDPYARRIFYDRDGRPKAVGERVVNPAYGATLNAIALQGASAFYQGAIAQDIVRAVRSHARPGDLTEEDLLGYRAKEREPLCGPYRVWRVCSMPPPSSGGVALLQILGLLERTAFAERPAHSAEAVHLFAEASRLAFADRARYLGDPDYVDVPVDELLDPGYLSRRVQLIGERALELAPAGDPESSGTTHFTILDGEGNIVSMTSTVEAAFGSRILVRGFFLNNELTDFDFRPGGPNAVAGGKRPRSSMAPAIVFGADGEVRLALGSPGGPRIIGYVASTLVGVLDWKLPLPEAIAAPNFGNRNGPTELEAGTSYERLAPALRARGHEVAIHAMTSGLHGIERFAYGWRGGADPRRDGTVGAREPAF